MDREIPESRQETNGPGGTLHPGARLVDGTVLVPAVIGDAILIVLGWMRANVWIVALSMTLGKLARYAILVAAALGIIESI